MGTMENIQNSSEKKMNFIFNTLSGRSRGGDGDRLYSLEAKFSGLSVGGMPRGAV